MRTPPDSGARPGEHDAARGQPGQGGGEAIEITLRDAGGGLGGYVGLPLQDVTYTLGFGADVPVEAVESTGSPLFWEEEVSGGPCPELAGTRSVVVGGRSVRLRFGPTEVKTLGLVVSSAYHRGGREPRRRREGHPGRARGPEPLHGDVPVGRIRHDPLPRRTHAGSRAFQGSTGCFGGVT